MLSVGNQSSVFRAGAECSQPAIPAMVDGFTKSVLENQTSKATAFHAEKIRAEVTKTKSDSDLLELAIERNASHGLQLSQEDKRDMARRIYHAAPDRERDAKKKQLAKILSVSERTIRDWLSRIDKDSKEARDKRIFELWLACYTQDEIAEAVGVSQGEVAKSIPNGDIAKQNKPSASHLADFEVPLYNVWKQQEKTAGSGHFLIFLPLCPSLFVVMA